MRQLVYAIPHDATRWCVLRIVTDVMGLTNGSFNILGRQLTWRNRFCNRQYVHYLLREDTFLLCKMNSRIVLKASDVAAILGRHQYKPRQDVLNDLWKKYAPQTFTGKTKKDKAEEALSVSSEAQAVLATALNTKAKDSHDVQKIYSEALEKVNSDTKLNATQKAEVAEHLRSKVYTTHGTRSEDSTSHKVEAEENVKWVKDNAFYTHDVCELGEKKFVVVGKIDRIEERPDGSKVLVEIKNRTNRLFRKVPEYEMIQVQVYLQMLGLVHARLVEQYNNQVLSHDITRDEEMWQNVIVPGLEEFCHELNDCMES